MKFTSSTDRKFEISNITKQVNKTCRQLVGSEECFKTFRTPLKPLEHHGTMVLTGLRGTLNWATIMPKATSLSDSVCNFFPIFFYTKNEMSQTKTVCECPKHCISSVCIKWGIYFKSSKTKIIIIIMVLFYLSIQYFAVLKEISIR